MSLLKFSRLISVSSEDPKYPGNNLLKPEISGCWKCKDPGEKQAVIILQFEKLSQIQSITVGNENSAFIEFLVGKSATPDVYEVLRVASVLMSVKDAKNDCNKNLVRFFKSEEFASQIAVQPWDRLKIICSQPFNKQIQYGLSFVKVYGKVDGAEDSEPPCQIEGTQTSLGKFKFKTEENEDEKPKIGSFFERRNNIDASLSTAAVIRAASNDPVDALSSSSTKRLSNVLQDLKENKRKRKNVSVSEVKPSIDGRRSTTGPLLYVDNVPDDETNAVPKRKKDKSPVASQNHSSSTEIFQHKVGSNEQHDKSSNIERKPFNRLLEDVVFVISGFQNPFRAELRSKALQMGAKYKADWDSSCTHLICAFNKTPKSNQVRGSGWILMKDWVEDCFQSRKRLKCVNYKLDKNDTFTNPNDKEIWEVKPENSERKTDRLKEQPRLVVNDEAIIPGSSKDTISTRNLFDVDTDIDSDEDISLIQPYENLTLKILPDFFNQKKFYMGTDLESSIVEMLKRYIIAFKGNIANDMDDVNFIISQDQKYKDNITNTPVILPDWIWECNDRKSLVSTEYYLLE